MLPDPDDDEQVAATGSGIARLAFARDADPDAGVDPGWDVDVNGPSDVHPAGPMTVAARVGYDGPAAAAPGTGPLDGEKALPLDDDAVPIAPPATGRPGTAFGAAAGTIRAEFLAGNRERLAATLGRLGQVDLEVVLEV